MTYPRSREGAAPVTVPLEDLALSDRESVFHAPRAGDVALLGVLVAVLLACGAWIWRQLGGESHAGRAFFFGLMLVCVYWCAIVYTLKLSLSVRISPRSVSVARGPWQVEIRWSELTRLMERMQTLDGRRYRWVIALARDGRRISVREDAIGDYARFRREAYERYRLYRDHGGTWGATGSGPFLARETVRDEAQWWSVAALMIALPGLYFTLLLPETNPLGALLLLATAACLAMLARAFLLRQTYVIERQYIEARSALKRARLTWAEVSKVERVRHPVSGIILSGVALGRFALRLASRGDAGIRSFAWSPRVPEYLVLRGGGRQTRIRLHRLMQPDELLAWIEFYDQVRRSSSATRSRPLSGPLAATQGRASAGPAPTRASAGPASGPTSGPLSGPLTESMPGPNSSPNLTSDLSGPSGPLDPWGAGRQGDPTASQPTAPRTLKTPFVAGRQTNRMLPDLPESPDAPPPGAVSWQPADAYGAAPDLPTLRTPAASRDDAWLRETNAQPAISDDAPPPAAVTPEPWGGQWQPASPDGAYDGYDGYGAYGAWQAEPDAPQMPTPQMPTPVEPPPTPDHWTAGHRWNDSQPTHDAPRSNEYDQSGYQGQYQSQYQSGYQGEGQGGYQGQYQSGYQGEGQDEYHDEYQGEEQQPTGGLDAPHAPWRSEGWQPPILPRFGPQRDDDPDQR